MVGLKLFGALFRLLVLFRLAAASFGLCGGTRTEVSDVSVFRCETTCPLEWLESAKRGGVCGDECGMPMSV